MAVPATFGQLGAVSLLVPPEALPSSQWLAVAKHGKMVFEEKGTTLVLYRAPSPHKTHQIDMSSHILEGKIVNRLGQLRAKACAAIWELCAQANNEQYDLGAIYWVCNDSEVEPSFLKWVLSKAYLHMDSPAHGVRLTSKISVTNHTSCLIPLHICEGASPGSVVGLLRKTIEECMGVNDLTIKSDVVESIEPKFEWGTKLPVKYKAAPKKEGEPDQNLVSAMAGAFADPVDEKIMEQYVNSAQEHAASAGIAKLFDATEMYQPVFGTDPGSVYYVIGIAPTVKVAARVKYQAGHTRVSIRVEGNGAFHGSLSARLDAMGFSTTPNSHKSIHLNSNAEAAPSRIIGSILMGLEVDFSTPMPKIKTLGNLCQ